MIAEEERVRANGGEAKKRADHGRGRGFHFLSDLLLEKWVGDLAQRDVVKISVRERI